MTLISPKFTLSRQDAADLLAVSTRTLDRYIRSKRLSSRKKGGSILLSEEEVNNLKVSQFQNMHGASPEVEGRAHRHIDSVAARQNATIFDAETGTVEENPVAVAAPAKSGVAKGEREKVFEELYDLSRREVREYHNKLEAANYRLGQMEMQLKHSVPLLDYHAKEEVLKQQDEIIQGKVKRQEETLSVIEHELRSERLNKNIYMGLLFGLLALMPLLWLMIQG
ncbi:helix-turn-helix domain-containing protein [Candidatus Peregrinibacteria bacterium]|nr:MAG: helix-turn-helix domain-containing protein [Candidatus Peregrinibacteria bacterium]